MKAARPLPPCVLTIAGSDSGAGAGVQADARTIHALGGFACMAITAITAQNTRGVRKWRSELPAIIAAQIEAVLGVAASASEPKGRPLAHARGYVGGDGRLPVRAIKTGLLPGAAAVRAIARVLKSRAIPLVIDPVIGSTSGTRFLDAAGLRALKNELLPLATLVTPNWPEAEALLGWKIATAQDADEAARDLAREIGAAVLLKGGHAPGAICRDVLVLPNGRLRSFESSRVRTSNTHGTGCVLSAAIATELAKGRTVEAAVVTARSFLQRALKRGATAKWGGTGPAFAG